MVRSLAFAAALLASTGPAGGQALINGVPPLSVDVRSMDVTLDATGAGTWTFTADGSPPFAGVPDVTHLPQAVNTTDLLICNYTARTVSSVSVRCQRVNPLSGLLTGLFGGTMAGLKVNLMARYKP